MKSVMVHQFSEVPQAKMPRSSFDRSHGLKTTFDAGYLVPILVDEALPGDTFTLDTAGFARLATPIFPTMDNLIMETFFFAVPNRLLWENWEKFNGAQTNPGDSTDFTIPIITSLSTGFPNESVYDYMGLPTKITPDQYNFSALPLRAYNLIWNEWFRDQNLQNSITINTNNGPDTQSDYVLKKRGKRHDYFTSCLPWPQKGDAVSIPLGTSAPVISTGGLIQLKGITSGEVETIIKTTGVQNVQYGSVPSSTDTTMTWQTTGLQADLTTATAATINQLRESFQIQKLLERDARGGTRYVEIIKSHFGVTSPDFRLQRPEFLGGGRSYINVTPIAQTSSTDGTSPQANLAGIGTTSFINHGFTKSFTEHCVIIGLVNVRADLTYQQGLDRMWSRSTRYDFYWPSFAHLGEQTVLSKEIYCDGTANDEDVFGYQERYAEYRYKPSKITGKFRSNDSASLDAWHYSIDFASRPVLNASFIEDTPPIDRTIAVPAEPHFMADFYFKMRCARPMPLYSVPGLIDHF